MSKPDEIYGAVVDCVTALQLFDALAARPGSELEKHRERITGALVRYDAVRGALVEALYDSGDVQRILDVEKVWDVAGILSQVLDGYDVDLNLRDGIVKTFERGLDGWSRGSHGIWEEVD